MRLMLQRESYKLWRQSVMVAFLCLLCSVSLQAQSRRNNRAPSNSSQLPLVDIRQIDFRNFAYQLNGRTYKLRDGFFAENIAEGARWELGMVDGPFYGDLTGDGKDEVTFVLSYGTGQAANTAEARIYTLQGGRVVLLATLMVKQGVACELDHYIRVTDGMLILERVYGKQDLRCDYNEITEYRWSANSFVPIGTSTRTPCRCM